MRTRSAIGALLFAGVAFYAAVAARSADVVNAVNFACDEGKTIAATFYADEVDLKLSDGRAMTLTQTMSGSGIRYASADESFVFWSKGNTAFVTEGADQTQTYVGCILVNDVPGGADFETFASATHGFSIRYPKGWTVNPNYRDESWGPGHEITGVSFTIPKSMTTGTNLADDTRLAVETLPDASTCTADQFLPGTGSVASPVTDDGTEYSVATFSDAGAGNIFDQTVYALSGTSPCLGVVYVIHSSNIGNFDPGAVTAFDRAKLTAEFDTIRRSLVIGR